MLLVGGMMSLSLRKIMAIGMTGATMKMKGLTPTWVSILGIVEKQSQVF